MTNRVLLKELSVNGKYKLFIYQGNKSEYDIIIKYKELINGSYTRERTPKHIHMAVDLLIKLHDDELLTNELLDFLIQQYQLLQPISSNTNIETDLSLEHLLADNDNIIERTQLLNVKGEYSVKFLILVIKLLMIQEKTNYPDGVLFQELLNKFKSNPTIWDIVSKASFNRR
ncbi:MAG: hypothetical protein K2Q03_00670 [Sphingobacteriaceae bacterium]|nr:hypothetical protein [Sphingobacteriaceae bacterium]